MALLRQDILPEIRLTQVAKTVTEMAKEVTEVAEEVTETAKVKPATERGAMLISPVATD